MTNPAHAVLDRFARFVQNELKMLEVVAKSVRDDDATQPPCHDWCQSDVFDNAVTNSEGERYDF